MIGLLCTRNVRAAARGLSLQSAAAPPKHAAQQSDASQSECRKREFVRAREQSARAGSQDGAAAEKGNRTACSARGAYSEQKFQCFHEIGSSDAGTSPAASR